jgi:hypothetical protein
MDRLTGSAFGTEFHKLGKSVLCLLYTDCRARGGSRPQLGIYSIYVQLWD